MTLIDFPQLWTFFGLRFPGTAYSFVLIAHPPTRASRSPYRGFFDLSPKRDTNAGATQRRHRSGENIGW